MGVQLAGHGTSGLLRYLVGSTMLHHLQTVSNIILAHLELLVVGTLMIPTTSTPTTRTTGSASEGRRATVESHTGALMILKASLLISQMQMVRLVMNVAQMLWVYLGHLCQVMVPP